MSVELSLSGMLWCSCVRVLSMLKDWWRIRSFMNATLSFASTGSLRFASQAIWWHALVCSPLYSLMGGSGIVRRLGRKAVEGEVIGGLNVITYLYSLLFVS